MQVATRSRKLEWLELGRGLAALAVVITHLSPWFDRHAPWEQQGIIRHMGGYAVEFFFILSGFIILHVHQRDLSRPGRLPTYLWRRAIRVLPIYWFVLCFALLINQLFQGPDHRAIMTTSYVLRQIFFGPGDYLLIGPAWTLRHELLFYAVFGMMILSLRLGLIIFLAWMAVIFVHLLIYGPVSGGSLNDVPGILFHHYNFDFALGMLVAVATRTNALRRFVAVLLVGSFIAILFAAGQGFRESIASTIADKLVFTTIVAACVVLSRKGFAVPDMFMTLGAMSYALYISHMTVMVVVHGTITHLLPRIASSLPATFLLELLCALAVGWLLHDKFEMPAGRRLRNLPFHRGSNHEPRHPTEALAGR